MKKVLYIDMDGTLARFHDADKMFIEAMWTPGFYVNLKPFENLVEAIKLLIKRNPDIDVNILSAVLDTDPPFIEEEKNVWFDTHLPEVEKEQRIFTKAGEDKSKYIDMDRNECYLLDDYNKNLYEFETAGGKSIKFRNDINHRGLGEFGGSKGKLWEGNIVNYDDSPEVICSMLEKYLGIEKELNEFVIVDDVLVEYLGNNETVKVPEGIKEIGINAFWSKTNVVSVELPNSLETISSGAFSDCKRLTDIQFPDGLKKIDKNAFIGCESLEQVAIPASVTFLHNQAFDSCENLKHINIDIENEKYFSVTGIVFMHDKDIYVLPDVFRCPTGKTGKIIFGNEIDKIEPEAFKNCTHITGVQLPKTLYAIADGAFYNCSSLEEIEIPPCTTQIFDSVFAECINLKKVVMSENLQIMNSGIFSGCKSLSEIVISDEKLIEYCERFNFLDEVYMTPCYEQLKERYDSLTKGKSVDNIIKDANKRVTSQDEVSKEDYTK